MSALSPKSERLISALFSKQPETYRTHIRELLETEVRCESLTAEAIERIRFAAIRLIAERRRAESDVVALAKTDWRDLLMAADFGEDIKAHQRWFTETVETTNDSANR